MRELAKTLGRDYKNVPQDVATLQSAGLLLREGRKLIAPWDELQDSIKAAGYTPELVDEVYITHMHADHVGGLMAGDKLAFPNAIVRSGKRNANFWPSKENLAKAREAMKGFFPGRAGLGSTQKILRTGRQRTLAVRGLPRLVPRHWPCAHRWRRLCLDAGELHGYHVNKAIAPVLYR